VLDLIQPANLTSCSHHPYGALISDCRSLIQKLEDFRIQHIFREGNATADILAKAGTKLSCPFVLFDYPPTFVINQVVADSWGVKLSPYIVIFCNVWFLSVLMKFLFTKKKKISNQAAFSLIIFGIW
jgi:hypothetical protein